MEVIVDVAANSVRLEDPRNLRAFSVLVRPGSGEESIVLATEILAAHNVGRLDPVGTTAFLGERAVRDLALAAFGGDVPAGWDEDFRTMLEYAGAKGWIGDDGAIQAHVEFAGTGGGHQS